MTYYNNSSTIKNISTCLSLRAEILHIGKDDIAAVMEKLLDWNLPIDNLHKSKTVQT